MNKEKLAVIGSGISGLSASLFLSQKFDLLLLEKNNYLGGHTRTKKILDDFNEHDIDTGFIVFNNQNYPDLKNFFNYLDVKTLNSNMSFSVSLKNPNLEYGGSNFRALFAQSKNLFSLKFLHLIKEIRNLYKHCKDLQIEENYKHLTLENFLDQNNYSSNIRNLHIYPMVSSIWSSNKEDVRNFPFFSFINFFKNHGLFNFNDRPQWKYVKGGSKQYVDILISKKMFNVKKNFFVKKIIREKNKIIIVDNYNEKIIVDKIVLATHADQSLSLLEQPSEKEKKILSKFQYSKNTAYLHSDIKLMPRENSAWSSWNFIGNTINDENFSLTYWMNLLQKIQGYKNFFVSINPIIEPDFFYDHTIFEHPIFNLDTILAQKNISEIQGHLNTYYCGSYCGYGFHEDGIQSAAHVADILKVKLPWQRDKNFKNRLYYAS